MSELTQTQVVLIAIGATTSVIGALWLIYTVGRLLFRGAQYTTGYWEGWRARGEYDAEHKEERK